MLWSMPKKKNSENHGKWEKHTVGSGIWRETWKHLENETQTLYDLENGKKHGRRWKIRNAHFRTWKMARKRKNIEHEKHTL